MSVTVGTWRRYSWRAVSLPAKPRCQPSIMASENAHAHDVAHVTHVSARHGSRCAIAWPHSTAATPMRIAGTVPQPTWAFHQPKIGAVSAKLWNRCGVGVDQRGDGGEVQVGDDERRDHQHHADGDRDRLPSRHPHDRQPIGRR